MSKTDTTSDKLIQEKHDSKDWWRVADYAKKFLNCRIKDTNSGVMVCPPLKNSNRCWTSHPEDKGMFDFLRFLAKVFGVSKVDIENAIKSNVPLNKIAPYMIPVAINESKYDNFIDEIVKESVILGLADVLNEVDTHNIADDDIIVNDRGYEFLKTKIEELNKRAKRWHLPPMEIKVLKDELVKKTIYRNSSGIQVSAGFPGAIPIDVQQKQYTIKLDGKPPRVDGWEFIAKIEHTDGGNIINMAPDSSIKSLPEDFKKGNATCDVCSQNRERFNTFVLKEEKTGKLIKSGSGCLKRFLPSISVNALINYAHMLEEIRESISSGEFDDDNNFDERGMPNKYRNYFPMSDIMTAIATAYLVDGKYISNTKATEFQTTSTTANAVRLMFPPIDKESDDRNYFQKAKALEPKGKELAEKVLDWAKNYDFDAQSEKNPDYANLYNNMQVLAHASSANLKNIGYIGAILSFYLREMNMLNNSKNAGKKPSEFIGTIGQKVSFEGKLIRTRTFDGSYGTTYIYTIEDTNGNRVVWFSSGDVGIVDGESYKFIATVKKQEISKFDNQKETIVTRAKVTKMTGEKINENYL